MHSTHLRRLSLLGAMLLTLLLVVPAAARADDRSFADAAIAQAVTLDRYEGAASMALQAVETDGERAVPGARRALELVRRQIDRYVKAVKPVPTSTEHGAATKRRLFAVFADEKREYGMIDRAFVAALDGDVRTARTLLSRAKKAVVRTRREAAALAETLRRMAA